jgi:hypothetical protein
MSWDPEPARCIAVQCIHVALCHCTRALYRDAASRSVDATVLKLISADAVVELPSAQPGAFFTHIAA